MDTISIALAGIEQSTQTLAHAAQSLSVNATVLVRAIRDRETLLIEAARKYPDLSPDDIRAAFSPGIDEKRQ